ncbi:MAG: alpha/beta fold hydrolase [Deltaproteobacteria bacterium]|nr:alpha/beta fold hydrolase [Deltaproteobacteria bacterium]
MLDLPRPSPEAFVVDVPAGVPVRGSALLLHGFTGSPFEVLTTAHTLAGRGFTSVGPLLAGHGSDPAVLNHVPWQRWFADVVAAFDALPAEGPRVVVGCSMGGLLALQLSLLRAVDAVVLLAPALRFHPLSYVGVAALTAGLWRVRPFFPKEGPGGDVGALDAQRANPTYKVLPTRGLVELWRLQLATEALLPRVTAPLCLLHGARDHTIAPSSSTLIAQTVASSLVEHHRLMNTQHLVALDVERDLANALTADFVDGVVRSQGVQ